MKSKFFGIMLCSFNFDLYAQTTTLIDTRLEKEAREIITYHCGDCHISGSSRQNPRALKVYDLNNVVWYKTMSASQITKSSEMLKNRLKNTDAELNEFFLSKRVKVRAPTSSEIKIYEKFVRQVILQQGILFN
ncbi:MAG: hypothetical protein WC635_14240 [Bacteriovorax sp.]|jgi:hypothetical protein